MEVDWERQQDQVQVDVDTKVEENFARTDRVGQELALDGDSTPFLEVHLADKAPGMLTGWHYVDVIGCGVVLRCAFLFVSCGFRASVGAPCQLQDQLCKIF